MTGWLMTLQQQDKGFNNRKALETALEQSKRQFQLLIKAKSKVMDLKNATLYLLAEKLLSMVNVSARSNPKVAAH